MHDESCITAIIYSKYRRKITDSFSKGCLILVNKVPAFKDHSTVSFKKHIFQFGANRRKTTPPPPKPTGVFSMIPYISHCRVSSGRNYISFLSKAVLWYLLFLNLVTLSFRSILWKTLVSFPVRKSFAINGIFLNEKCLG